MKVLIVKLSSLGDVVHTLPLVQDIRRALPQAQIDWVVERGFAPLFSAELGLGRVIACDLRRWRRSPWSRETRAQWRAFKAELQACAYDAVIDAQGLSKSAWIAWLAHLSPAGQRYAMANRTAGSSYEAPTRWLAHRALAMPWQSHAVERGRLLGALALGYEVQGPPDFGFASSLARGSATGRARRTPEANTVVFVHGCSRADKAWPSPHWLALGQRLLAQGHRIGLPHGSDAEQAQAQALAQQLGQGGAVEVWPRLDLHALRARMGTCAAVIGVDSGLSHIAVALNLPHVQIYNFDTAWRTGPLGRIHQRSVYAASTPSVDTVWRTWLAVRAAGASA